MRKPLAYYSLAPSNRNQAPAAVCRKHERRSWVTSSGDKRWSTPPSLLVLSATGGMGNETTIFYKRLASLFAQIWAFLYSTTLCWLRCHQSYSLLHSFIQAIWFQILAGTCSDVTNCMPSTLLPPNHIIIIENVVLHQNLYT